MKFFESEENAKISAIQALCEEKYSAWQHHEWNQWSVSLYLKCFSCLGNAFGISPPSSDAEVRHIDINAVVINIQVTLRSEHVLQTILKPRRIRPAP